MKTDENLLINVVYTIKPGKKAAFFNQLNEIGIADDSRREPGCIKYEYFLPVDSEDQLFLMEMWVNAAAQEMHGKTEHFRKLQALKDEYVTEVTIDKYQISKC